MAECFYLPETQGLTVPMADDWCLKETDKGVDVNLVVNASGSCNLRGKMAGLSGCALNKFKVIRGETPLSSSIEWLSPDEQDEWDAFVTRHPLGLIYHLSSWQRVIESSFKHIRGRVLVLRDNGGQIQAGLPLYTVSSWLLGNRMVSVPFATMCDPLVSTKEEFALLWPAIEEGSKKPRTRRIEIRTRHVSTDSLPGLLTPGTRFKHHYLPLAAPTEELFRAFDKSNIRRGVEKARREGIIVEQREDQQDLRALHAILVQARRRRSLPPMPFVFFESMHRCLGKDRVAMYLAMHAGEPVGALLALKFRDLWTGEYVGVSDHPVRGISALLHWETIQQAKSSGAACFSFGRTSLDNTGLLEHKRRWATLEEDLTDFIYRPGSLSARDQRTREEGGLASSYALVRLLMRYTPSPVHKFVGDFAYRHLG